MSLVRYAEGPDPYDAFFDDLIIDAPYRRWTKWEDKRAKDLAVQKKYGTDRYMSDYDEEEEVEEVPEEVELVYEEGKKFTNRELEQLADNLLRADARRELCRRCSEYGELTGHIESQAQYHEDGTPVLDENDDQLYVDFPELECSNGHRWYRGEGKARTTKGSNPILFEEHLKNRHKREIQTEAGTPDPNIVSGLYNRSHPQGRKINSLEQRKRHGAGYYR
jgi:hypothetical protein